MVTPPLRLSAEDKDRVARRVGVIRVPRQTFDDALLPPQARPQRRPCPICATPNERRMASNLCQTHDTPENRERFRRR